MPAYNEVAKKRKIIAYLNKKSITLPVILLVHSCGISPSRGVVQLAIAAFGIFHWHNDLTLFTIAVAVGVATTSLHV